MVEGMDEEIFSFRKAQITSAFENLFSMLDANNSGFIEIEEFEIFLKSPKASSITNARLGQLILKCGTNLVESDQAILQMRQRCSLAEEYFSWADKDNDGKLCYSEMVHMMLELSEKGNFQQTDSEPFFQCNEGSGSIFSSGKGFPNPSNVLDLLKYTVGDRRVLISEVTTPFIIYLIKYIFDNLQNSSNYFIDIEKFDSIFPLLISDIVDKTIRLIGKDKVSKLPSTEWENLISNTSVFANADIDEDGILNLRDLTYFFIDLFDVGEYFKRCSLDPYIEVVDISLKIPFLFKLIEVLINIASHISATTIENTRGNSKSVFETEAQEIQSANLPPPAAESAKCRRSSLLHVIDESVVVKIATLPRGPAPSLKNIFQKIRDDTDENEELEDEIITEDSPAPTSTPTNVAVSKIVPRNSNPDTPTAHAQKLKTARTAKSRQSTADDYSSLYRGAGSQEQEVNVFSSSHVIKASILNKKGMGKSSLGFYRPWSKRYFVLRSDRTLSYYGSEGGDIKGKEFLHAGVEFHELTPEKADGRNHALVIKGLNPIKYRGNGSLVLSANSQIELLQWISVLENIGGLLHNMSGTLS